MSSLGRTAHIRLVMPHLRLLILLALSLLSAVAVSAETVTQIENGKPGTSEWEIVYKTKTSPSVDFFPDRHFTKGTAGTYEPREIDNTEDDALYLTIRYSPEDFEYKIPAKNGNYTLKLHFAECTFDEAGERRFHVNVNGTPVLSNFDIFKEAGGQNTALVKSFNNQEVTDGFVTVKFIHDLSFPVVAAIELIPNDPAGTTTRIDAGGYGDAALDHEIEGYASLTSVNRGGQINFFVNSSDPTYTIDIYRMGWYGGLGARKVAGPFVTNDAQAQPPCPILDSYTGFLECNWASSHLLTIPNNPSDPTDWASGVYLAKLTGISGKQSYIIFVVRDDGRASDFLYQSPVTTYQAYNNWGGKSLYDYPLSSGDTVPATSAPESGCDPEIATHICSKRAAKVSFNRPYAPNVFPNKREAATGAGAGEFLTNVNPYDYLLPAGREYNVVRFLEREGYDVTYCTNIDIHTNPNLIAPHKAFLSVGHDEYWTWQMRANVEAARDAGHHLAFLSSNTAFYQIRLEPSGTGQADRTMVGYKYRNQADGSTGDPFADADPSNDHLITVFWRDPRVNRPEDSLIGVMYNRILPVGAPLDTDIVIANSSHWACRGACSPNGNDTLRRLLGVEADAIVSQPSPVETSGIIGESTYAGVDENGQSRTGVSHMTTYDADAPSGATVFATGTMVWGWGLDDFNKEIMGPVDDATRRPTQDNLVNAKAQGITRNVLARFMGKPCPSAGETIWMEDGLPPGAVSVPGTHTFNDVTWTNEAWNWKEEPRPYASELSARSGLQPGIHQLYFSSATTPLAVNAGDKLIAYVYLDPHNPPTEVMLSWNSGGSWEHRAYWGANEIPWGAGGTQSRRFKGGLPRTGQWARLEVAAADVGLEGHSLTGMALTLYGGRANWDHLGKLTAPAPGKCN